MTDQGIYKGGIFLSGDHGSAGKTTVTLGLIMSLRDYSSAKYPVPEGGRIIQPFKKGPDFIDPIWHSCAAGRSCRNLDFYISPATISEDFNRYSAHAHISVIEGNKGLFDGVDTMGSDSGSAMARLLGLPVILVVDASKSTRGVAALLQGYLNFEKDLQIAGVIVNRIAGSRHESKVRAAIEYYTPIRYLGALPRDSGLSIDERHLGLMPAQEHQGASEKLTYIKDRISECIDLDGILDAAGTAPPLQEFSHDRASGRILSQSPLSQVTIAVAKDAAFSFYYPENLEALEENGARLVYFSPLSDAVFPPEADAFYFGGGFPEVFRSELQANTEMRRSLYQALVLNEMPAYAECGGLMYLTQSIQDGDSVSSMVGALPYRTIMTKKPQGRGYMSFSVSEQAASQASEKSDWKLIPGDYKCHEFHYSKIEPLEGGSTGSGFFYEVTRGFGVDGKNDGIIYKNILASYAHLTHRNVQFWAESFTEAARKASLRRIDAQWQGVGRFSCGCEL